jgi:hypothetical protein
MASRAEVAVHADALRLLNEAGVPYVVAGAYALRHHTGIERYTKDLDLFLVRSLVPRALALLARAGYQTHVLARHWLANAQKSGYVVDLIHGFGGWRAQVDQSWYDHAMWGTLNDVPVRFAPIEEMTWMKVYVAHRERFDGADVCHLIKAGGERFDWQRFVSLFGPCWELLLSAVALFQFVYPSDRRLVPAWVTDTLLDRLSDEQHQKPPAERVCRGTLLDRFSYLPDVDLRGYADGRVPYAIAQGYRPDDVAADRREALQMIAAGRVRPSRVA